MDTPFTIVMYRTFHAQRNAIRPGMADIGLSPGQPKILHYLLNHDGCMQRELADACDTNRPRYPVCWIKWRRTVWCDGRSRPNAPVPAAFP